MRALLVITLALLCLSQAEELNPKDILKQILLSASNYLVEEQLEKTEVSTEKVVTCNAKNVVDSGSNLIKDTVDILKESFDVFYSLAHKSNGCNLGAIRCFLKDFTETKDLLTDVKGKVRSYAQSATNLTNDISDYFRECVGK